MARKPLFERLKEGLEDGVAYQKGDIELKTFSLSIPGPPKTYAAEDIKALRRSFQMSQTAFSRLLSVSKKTVEGWEQGLRTPSGSAARLLQFIENPKLLEARTELAGVVPKNR